MDIILASSSPFRQQLLNRLQINFTTISPNIDEDQFKNLNLKPYDLAMKLSFEKAKVIHNSHPDSIVIGSDQVCFSDGAIFDKPMTEKEAVKQLTRLSNSEHQLFTAYCLLYQGKKIHHCDLTNLKMKDLSQDQIKTYISKDQPLYCAGSYKVESLGLALFDSIETQDSTAIIGLPLTQLIKDLATLGHNIL